MAITVAQLLSGFLWGITSLFLPHHADTKWPAVGSCNGSCSNVVDPAMTRRKDGVFFRFSTGDGIHIAKSYSVAGPWNDAGQVLPNGSKIELPGNQDLWAPDIFQKNDTYYLYYAVSSLGTNNSDIGVATSTSLEMGSWTDHGSIGIPTSPTTKQKYNRIDPNMLQPSPASLAKGFMTFGSFWSDIWQIQMADPPLKVLDAQASPPTQLAYNSSSPANGAAAHALEGGFIFWWPVKGVTYYYLFFSSGTCCAGGANPVQKDNTFAASGDEYKIMVCRSLYPDKGYTDASGRNCTENGGEIVLGSHGDMYAPGGQGVIFDDMLKTPVLFYHYVNRTLGTARDLTQFGWNKLNFTNGWPSVVA